MTQESRTEKSYSRYIPWGFFPSFKLKKLKQKELSLEVINPHAAGIDVGSRSHFVAVDQLTKNVREFGVYTEDHQALVDYLKSHAITTVAMESTGSYWQTLFSALQSAGFDVVLVCSTQTKNVKGKKTDVLDCMWIQKLHTLGLLSGSFLLTDRLQELRVYYNHRKYLIEQSSKYINKMQKALRLMNIRLDVVLNDITGMSGKLIIQAILEGHRDPVYLASLTSHRVKKSKQEIAASLQGQWRDELLFELKSCFTFYAYYSAEIRLCDDKIEALLTQNVTEKNEPASKEGKEKKTSKKVNKFSPVFNVSQLAQYHLKTDLFAIEGVSHTTVLCFLCCMGTDIKRFASARQFASWLRLVPNNKKSGGQVISSRTPKGKNQIALALRQAANSIGNQKSGSLNAFFKRIAFRRGRQAAITATARKLAVVIWNMVVKQEDYRMPDLTISNEKRKKAELKHIERRIIKLDLTDEQIQKLFARTSLATS